MRKKNPPHHTLKSDKKERQGSSSKMAHNNKNNAAPEQQQERGPIKKRLRYTRKCHSDAEAKAATSSPPRRTSECDEAAGQERPGYRSFHGRVLEKPKERS